MATENNKLFEYEKYELVFKHYITEDNGKNVPLDEPIICTACTPIGVSVCKSDIVRHLLFEMLNHLNKE